MNKEPKLQNVIKDLHPIMQECLALLKKEFNFKTVECCRTIERQKWLVENGKSWTMDSNHIRKSAADLYPLPKGYQTDMKIFQSIHDSWDKIVGLYHKEGFIVTPEPRIGKDIGHFGMRITCLK